jgi:hypothetical protein
MCPVCIATAALIASKVTSAGGLAAIGIRKFGVTNAAGKNPAPTPSNLCGEESAVGEIVPNSNQRRDQYANDRDSER